MTHIVLAFCLLFLAITPAAADDAVHPVPLILYPAAAPSPALKYCLLPELRDTIPGNAVTHYRQAVKNLEQSVPLDRDWYPKKDQWLATPLKDFPCEEVGKFLKQCETTFQEVEAGAFSEQCDWELTQRLRKTAFFPLPPELQGMRAVAFLLQLRIRLELAEGHTLEALHKLRTGFAVARHVAGASSSSCALLATSIAAMMEYRLEELIQQPDAPNLYWSLTDLPRPFIDMRKPMESDRVQAYSCFPGMAEMAADLNAKPFTTEQVEKAVSALAYLKDQNNDLQRFTNEAAMALRLAARHEAAKKILIDQGRPKELVDAMPQFQVGLLVALQQYDEWFDESLKWRNLPFGEAQAEMTKASKRIDEHRDGSSSPALSVARQLLPAVQRVLSFSVRIDRRIAALRCVEAVRLYAAAHDGKLPPSLEKIKDAPTPLDPVTGKAFDYRVVGDHAFLTCTPFPDQPPSNANTPSYELIIKHKGDQ